jgi:hypothetical protein
MIDNSWNHENSIRGKALLIILGIRYFSNDPVEYSKATQQLQSLMQAAIVDGNGVRWKTIADSDDLETSAEESLALVIEALEAGKQEQEFGPGIIKWLMTYKNEQQWHTTKGTSAIIDLLLKQRNSVVAATHTMRADFNEKSIKVSDDILYGSTSAFCQTETIQSIRLRKEEDEPINANIGWYHFSNSNDLNRLNKEVNINKSWYHINHQTKEWELSDSNFVYKVGEKVKIVIALESSKALRYVWINDKRSGAFEPEEYNSGYQYGRYFGYYQSIRDAGINFFAEFIPSGKTQIEYEMIVAQEGEFSGGMAMLQCIYNPSVTSYSSTQSIISKSGSGNFAD